MAKRLPQVSYPVSKWKSTQCSAFDAGNSLINKFRSMSFSRNQIIGAIALLLLIWLVIAIRLIISRG
jgi:hypothetical protein